MSNYAKRAHVRVSNLDCFNLSYVSSIIYGQA